MSHGKIIWLKEVDSTNRYAIDNFANLEDGALVLAEQQTAGRGRLGRVWVSPPQGNIYASFVMKDLQYPAYHASRIGGMAVLATLREFAPDLKFWLKWPNDVYCREKKICGILCEAKTGKDNSPEGVVLGMGINLNMSSEALKSVGQPATSLFIEKKCKVNSKIFAKSLDIRLNRYYSINSTSPQEFFALWKSENILIGQTVEIMTGKEPALTGKIEDIGPEGELIFSSGDKVLRLYSGDITINKSSINFDGLL